MFSTRNYALTEEQRRMYASEKLFNFRWISKIVATYSPYILTDADLVPENIYQELAELGAHTKHFTHTRSRVCEHVPFPSRNECTNLLPSLTGQFAELAYSAVSIEFLLHNFATLSQPGFPLEGFNALSGVILVDEFRGSRAGLPVYIAYRPDTNQLIVSISGTSSAKHIFHDLNSLKLRHPSGEGAVHSGFWALYEGISSPALASIQRGIAEHSPREVVLTGHSMGGSVAYLLCAELLAEKNQVLSPEQKLKIAVFGCPRAGDAKFVNYVRGLIASFRKRRGDKAFQEYSTKAYNDGTSQRTQSYMATILKISSVCASTKVYPHSHQRVLGIGTSARNLSTQSVGNCIEFPLQNPNTRYFIFRCPAITEVLMLHSPEAAIIITMAETWNVSRGEYFGWIKRSIIRRDGKLVMNLFQGRDLGRYLYHHSANGAVLISIVKLVRSPDIRSLVSVLRSTHPFFDIREVVFLRMRVRQMEKHSNAALHAAN